MWVWFYPHLMLFILAYIYKVSCQEKSSLAFVIDNSASMNDDIVQVKENVNGISEIVFEEKASQIENMVLVTFNEPSQFIPGMYTSFFCIFVLLNNNNSVLKFSKIFMSCHDVMSDMKIFTKLNLFDNFPILLKFVTHTLITMN